MDAVIDIGNTFVKLGKILKGGTLQVISESTVPDLLEILREEKFERVIVSSVKNDFNDLNKIEKICTELIILDRNTPLPFRSQYKTPETLGPDRLAGIAGAQLVFSESNNLVIDCGTCITYDFITESSAYIGGGISPGLSMKLKALNTFTSKLPLVPLNENTGFVGLSTAECIQSGVFWGTVGEIESTIQRYQMKFGEMNVVLTGGDAIFFESKINTPIFVRSNLVLEGLKGILEFNK